MFYLRVCPFSSSPFRLFKNSCSTLISLHYVQKVVISLAQSWSANSIYIYLVVLLCKTWWVFQFDPPENRQLNVKKIAKKLDIFFQKKWQKLSFFQKNCQLQFCWKNDIFLSIFFFKNDNFCQFFWKNVKCLAIF